MHKHSVDCIVRFHDVKRLVELNRCIFSLLGQSYRPLNIILVLQRFSAPEVEETRQELRSLLEQTGAPTLTLCNLEQPLPHDARTLLLNIGLRAARGRYVTFLDYDDVIYPEAYALLLERLKVSGAAIAFAGIRVVKVDVFQQFMRIKQEIKSPFGLGNSLRDLFDGNFCPIHSFMIDRERINGEDLYFDESLTWEEDYDFLLRICAKYKSDFARIDSSIGDYYYKEDGSNTIPVNGLHSPEQVQAYAQVSTMIEARRRTTIVSPEVQSGHGLWPVKPDMTIREFMTAVPGRT